MGQQGVLCSHLNMNTAACLQVVGDPSYFPEKVRRTSRVVRAMCILNHPLPNTNNASSAQIILPQRQVSVLHG